MTKFVITVDTGIKRIGIGYTGDGPQTDVSNSELSDIALAYFTSDWKRLHKACSSAIYHSREKPYFDPGASLRKSIAMLLTYSIVLGIVCFAFGMSIGGVLL